MIPTLAWAYNNRGSAKFNLKDYQGAIEDYDKAIELDPNYAKAYNNRGAAKGNLGDNQGAIKDYDKAIEIDPNAGLCLLKQQRQEDYAKLIPTMLMLTNSRQDYQGAIQDCD